MPQTRKQTSRETTRHAITPLLVKWQATGLGPLNWLAPTVVERMTDMGSEWLSFVAARVQEDVALQHGLLHAKSPEEAQAVQAKFLQKAMEDYSAESGRMMDLSAKLFDPVEAGEVDDRLDGDENVNV